jgi:cobalt-zinc-cadmium efflux system outer membrane protein
MRRAALILLFGAVVQAQQGLTLDEAVGTALGRHPLLAEGQRRIEAAQGQQKQAGLWMNPKLILQSENTRLPGDAPFVFGRDTDNFAYLQQTFETAGKRGKRVELASQGMRSAELELAVLRRQVAREVSLAYWAAAGMQRVHELLLETEKTFQQIVEYHEIRVREGAMAESDLLRVRLEAGRIAMAGNNAKLEAARARIELFRAMGATAFPEVRFLEPLEVKEDRGVAVEVAGALEKRPEVQLAKARLEQARRALVVTQANARPNFDALFGYKRTSGYNTMIGGVQVDLPFLNRNQGNVETAGAEIRAAEANLAATEAIVRAEVEAAGAEYEMRRKQVTEFLGQIRRQAAETAQIAQSAYRLGGADLLRLLDAERLRIEIDQLNYRAMMEYRQSIAVLEYATGVRP